MMLCLIFFFRDALLNGLHILYGDAYDGMIEVAILEHWHRVFTLRAAWDVTGYFYPFPATLGYNDTDLVPGIPFTLARIAGADPFLAAFLSHVAMKALGFLGMYVLLRRGLAVRTPLALAGAAVFATASASLLHMYHAQLLSVGLLPWLGLLAARTLGALRQDRSGAVIAYGCAFALLYGVSAFNAFYGLWFFSLFALIYAPVALALAGRDERRMLGKAVARHWASLVLCLLVGAIALLPLLLLYLPKIGAGAWHSWDSGPHLYLPDVTTLFNVGSGNLVWGRGWAALGHKDTLPGGELRFGLTGGMMVVALFAMLWARRERAQSGPTLALGITVVAMLALALRWPGDHSAWWYVYSYVPGATTVRVVSRLLLFLLVPIIVGVMLFLDRAPRSGWATALIVAGLLVEQVQLEAPLTLDRTTQRAMLTAVGPPPADCPAFFVVSARPRNYPLRAEAQRIDTAWGDTGRNGDALLASYRHNVDAMLLASYFGVPTINGISSFNPPGWKLRNPDAPDYLRRVAVYAKSHRLGRLCGLDMRRGSQWFWLDG